MSVYTVFTDGACKPNPGVGGYAVVILKDGEPHKEFSDSQDDTTNNRMELSAVVKAVELLPSESAAVVVSDSKYVINTINKGWARNANKDLWAELDKLREEKKQTVSWWWVKGHAGNEHNERADVLAQQAAEKLKKELNG